MDAGRYAANMAELFIMLVVMFLIQAVLNFSLSDTVDTSKRADLLSVSLRQVPSAEVVADHLAYLYLEDSVEITPGGQDPDLLASRINAEGECEDYLQPTQRPNKDNFAEISAERGIEYQQVSLEGMQTEHMFLWDPNAAGKGLVLRVGFHYCKLDPATVGALSVSPDWNLPESTLSRPHPLVITVSRYTEHISTATKIEYFHETDYPAPPFSKDQFLKVDGLSFTTKDCSVSVDGRREMVREIRLQLDDLI